jgi:pimeloyl-ACP methyl ester carboxylesterase
MDRVSIDYRVGYVASPAPLYYEQFTHAGKGQPPVMVLVHGGCLSGACYLGTPDGRPGWAHDFADQGYDVVVPDWPGIGRSGRVAEHALSGELVCAALGALLEHLGRPVVLLVHSMAGPFGYRLVETHGRLIEALVAIAPGPPGNIQPRPAVGVETDSEIEVIGPAARWRFPKTGDFVATEQFIQDKLIGRDSTRFPRQAVDVFRAGLLPLPAPLLLERYNLSGRQVRVERPDNFGGLPVLMVTGSADLEHPRDEDGATAAWLAGLGADVEYRFLADTGITGNGHMLMLEDNSHEIATSIVRWLEERTTVPSPPARR